MELDSGRTILPRVYEGPVPDFPLPNATVRELEVWGELWTRPQARVWHDTSQALEVGLYVRTLVEAEGRGASASVRSLALAQARALLLTAQSLKSAGYQLSDQRQTSAAGVKRPGRSVPSSRGRLQPIDFRDRLRPPGAGDD